MPPSRALPHQKHQQRHPNAPSGVGPTGGHAGKKQHGGSSGEKKDDAATANKKKVVVKTSSPSAAPQKPPLSPKAAAAKVVAEKPASNKVKKDGMTALHQASRWGKLDAVKKLLAKEDTKKEAKDNKGMTSLMHAAVNNHVQIVEALLEAGAAPENTDNGWLTALMHAVKAGHVDVVKVLLAKGSRPNGTNKFRQTALHQAALNGRSACVEAILSFVAADTESKVTVAQLAARKSDADKTARDLAVTKGHQAVLQVLSHHGIDA